MSQTQTENKGRAFEGFAGGKYYRIGASLFGMGPGFYRKGLGAIRLAAGQNALDLGCGPGALSFALAETADPAATITGIDQSEDQLAEARTHAGNYACRMTFRHGSMDELPFADDSFDLVMSSMAIHETPPPVRRRAIAETARVLRPGGLFLYVDWSKPRFGLWGIVWYPMLLGHGRGHDNWINAYPELCRACGMMQTEDAYITSIARRQLFCKPDVSNASPA